MAGSYRVWALAEENDHPLPQVARELRGSPCVCQDP